MNKGLSGFMDASRWIAAFFVVFGHAAHLLIADGPSPIHFLTSLGHNAVMVFFVISGYLVGGITLSKWMKGGPDIADYAINRFSRIYVVLVPALMLGYAVDYVGMTRFDAAGLYSNLGQLPIGSLDAVDPRLSPGIFIGNLLMLEGTAVTSLGSNGPLWSLAFEWWYYCLFCFFAAGLLYSGWKRAVLWACIIPLAAVLPGQLFLWMTIWLLGIGAFFVSRSKLRIHPIIGLAIFAVVVSIEYATRRPHEPMLIGFARDFVVGLAYCVALVSFSKVEKPMAKFHHWAAGFSYSMYLFHFPVLLLIVAIANQYGLAILAQPTVATIGILFAVTGALYVLGYLFSLATERHTDAVKALLKTLLTWSYNAFDALEGAQRAEAEHSAE